MLVIHLVFLFVYPKPPLPLKKKPWQFTFCLTGFCFVFFPFSVPRIYYVFFIIIFESYGFYPYPFGEKKKTCQTENLTSCVNILSDNCNTFWMPCTFEYIII